MICTKLLWRIECGSLYGLVAFLRALFNTLTEHDALWFLLLSNVNVALAIKMVEQQGHAMSGAYDDAYRNASPDLWHLYPDELLELVMSGVSIASDELLSLITNGSTLLIQRFVMYLSPKRQEQIFQLNQDEALSGYQKIFISQITKKFQADQEFFVKKSNTALSTYAKKNGVSTFPFLAPNIESLSRH